MLDRFAKLLHFSGLACLVLGTVLSAREVYAECSGNDCRNGCTISSGGDCKDQTPTNGICDAISSCDDCECKVNTDSTACDCEGDSGGGG